MQTKIKFQRVCEKMALENIDGYVSKDSLYRLLSNYRMAHVPTGNEEDLLREITVAIKDMPNELIYSETEGFVMIS